MRTDFTIKLDTGLLRIEGEPDPVSVDTEGVPFLSTEIKTKDSADRHSSPNDHYLAQAHAYTYGLTQEFDRRVTDVLLVYAGRTNLKPKIFHREFDPVFWRDDVRDWATSLSQFRIEDRLPPAEPKFDRECRFCSYRKRCGKQTDEIGNDGLLLFVKNIARPR